MGAAIGVVPQVELWGFSKTLNRLAETVYVATESGHPQACVLPDIYHLHKGGSSFDSMKLLSGVAVQVFHMNDYPANPPRESIKDEHRIYPGDGIAPLKATLRDMWKAGFRGVLSLELFNRGYWEQDALLVAKTRATKMGKRARVTLSGLRAAARGGVRTTTVPLFVGIDSVSIRKRLNITKAVRRARDRLPELYAQNFRGT